MEPFKDLKQWSLIYFQQKTGSASFSIFLGGRWKWKFRLQKCLQRKADCARYFRRQSHRLSCRPSQIRRSSVIEQKTSVCKLSASLCEARLRTKSVLGVTNSKGKGVSIVAESKQRAGEEGADKSEPF